MLAKKISYTDHFYLFDAKHPFLQDPSVSNTKGKKSVGSLFAEFSTGTNIAHFHHGDDEQMRLCLPCVTLGMLRVVPWSQSGGSGLTPSVHGAPPIFALAWGGNVAETLGLNLTPLPGERGKARWTGHFQPTDKNAKIPYLEALTWNPRQISLPSPEPSGFCWKCGKKDVPVIGKIVYGKNEMTKKGDDKKTFEWQDPAAFYSTDEPYKPKKSYSEKSAAEGKDLRFLLDQGPKKTVATVRTKNPDHEGWQLIIPCTNPANNKSFDHRITKIASFTSEKFHAVLPADKKPSGLAGWQEPTTLAGGMEPFIRAAVHLLSHGDWTVLSSAAYRDMSEVPAAFDVFAGLFWLLRDKKIKRPSKNAAWLVLKLMGSVPSVARDCRQSGGFNPLQNLPKRQIKSKSNRFQYPVGLPRGNRLEKDLRKSLDTHLRKRDLEPIDWEGLCYGLNQLLD